MLAHGEQVGEHLCRVPGFGQAVVHGNAGVRRQRFDGALREAAVFDGVVEAAEDARGVGDAFFVAKLAAAGAEVAAMCALVKAGDFKGAAGAGRGFLENQGDVFAAKACGFAARFFRGFERGGVVKQVEDGFARMVGEFEQAAVFPVIHGVLRGKAPDCAVFRENCQSGGFRV